MYACTFAISLVPTLCVTTCSFHKREEDFDVDDDEEENDDDGDDDDDDEEVDDD